VRVSAALCARKIMRTFSKIEQTIIARMIELDEKSGSLNVLGNVFDSFSNELRLPDYCYIKVASETDVSIQIKKEVIEKIDPSTLRVIDDELSKFLITTVKLFEYLENNGLAYFLGDLNVESLGQVWADTEYVTCEFLEEESKSLIYKYIRKKIYVTEELKELAHNDFKSKEDIKWNRELFYTRAALAVTFLGLMASILVPVFSTSKIEIKNPTQVHNIENELKKITSDLRVISSSLNDMSASIAEKGNNISKAIREIKCEIESMKINKTKQARIEK